MKMSRQSNKAEGIGNEAVQKRTGKTWDEWFANLDRSGARKMKHPEIAVMLHEKLGCSGWWSQMITVGYEQARGMREKHQKPEGYQISRSKTLAAPIAAAYKAWTDTRQRDRWLAETGFTVRKANINKSLRITWKDGKTSVEVFFCPKGPGNTQVVVQHSRLADARQAERAKAYWCKQLEKLQGFLET